MQAYSELLDRWKSTRALIDAAIEDRLRELPESDALEVARYIAMGGKRLRGFFLVELASALGADVEDALDAAVAVELVHAASLALDDIIDGDMFRRGRPASWTAYGVPKTVMVSNLLIPFAQTLVYRRYGTLALLRTIAAWLEVSRGEVIDAFYGEPRPELYMEMIRMKTGALFRLSAELAVIAAGALDSIDLAAEMGEKMGMVYQVADDIKDSMNPSKSGEPGLRFFKSWLGAHGLSKAYRYVEDTLKRIEGLMNKLLGSASHPLKMLPGFIVNAMLKGVDAGRHAS